MKKICIIIPYQYPIPAVKGGAVESLVQVLIEENEKKKKFNFIVMTTYDEKAELMSKDYKYSEFIYYKKYVFFDKALGLISRVFKKIFNIYIPVSIRFYKILKHLRMNSSNYDYILFENGLSYMIPIIAKVYPRERILNHMHWYGEGNKKIDKCFEYLLPVSEYIGNIWKHDTGRSYKKVIPWKTCANIELFNKKTTVEEQIKLREQLGINKNNRVILFIGRIVEIKGVLELIQAFSKLNYEHVSLLIIGSSSFGVKNKTHYEEKVFNAINNCPHNVIHTGYVHQTELYKYYNISDFLVFPSTAPESAGLVGIEAQAAGLPVIASNVGAIGEYADPNGSILIEYDDDFVNNLSCAMEKLIGDSNLLKVMGESAQKHAYNYTADKYYKDFCDIINFIAK